MTYAGGSMLRSKLLGPDERPAAPDPTDDEFDGPSLDTTKWTWLDQGGVSATQNNGRLTFFLSELSNRIRGITQPAPGGSWEFRTKVHFPFVGDLPSYVCIFAAEDATGEVRSVGIWDQAFRGISFSTPSSSGAGWGSVGSSFATETYLQIGWDGSDLTAGWSLEGTGFYEAATVTPTYTPTLVGLGLTNRDGTAGWFTYEWFRRWA